MSKNYLSLSAWAEKLGRTRQRGHMVASRIPGLICRKVGKNNFWMVPLGTPWPKKINNFK